MPRSRFRVAAVVAMLCGAIPAQAGRNLWPQPALGPSASGDPELLFTFDDGPHQDYTPRVLALLRAHRIRAIFFMTGWRLSGQGARADARRAAARLVVEEGHTLGNHTMSHAHLCGLRRDAAEREIDRTAALLTRYAGHEPLFFRTPYGNRCEKLEEMLARRRLSHLHWDLDPQEYWATDAGDVRTYFATRLRRRPGRSVILMHDTHAMSVRSLALTLEWLESENARRRARGERPIRILSYADVVREQLAPGLLSLAGDAGASARAATPGALRRLLGPLAGVEGPAAIASSAPRL